MFYYVYCACEILSPFNYYFYIYIYIYYNFSDNYSEMLSSAWLD